MVYNAINRRENGQSILEDTRPGQPSSWTLSMKVKLKRLVNNRKGVSQRKLGKQLNKHHTTIGRQIQKLGIDDYAREKTPKYTEEQSRNVHILFPPI
jgi:IS30 family transposase